MNRQSSSDVGGGPRLLNDHQQHTIPGQLITRVDSEKINHMLSPDCPKRYSVLLVSDYFYPNLGGVEMHMF